jgi:hypothetical protein
VCAPAEQQLTGIRALESILVATANALEEEMAFSRELVQRLLVDLEDDINRDNLKRLLHYSRRMVGFQSRARYVKRAVDEVLESGEPCSLPKIRLAVPLHVTRGRCRTSS